MQQTIQTQADMVALGQNLVKLLPVPSVIELVGDVGVGKTTLVKGIARGLGIKDEITSPSFTVHKQYVTPDCILSHYDFYRLHDPGIMADEIAETLQDQHAITVVEWAGSVQNVLPKNHITITINYNDDGSRAIETKGLKP
ncbi:tRNA (adenosine(37)-N6)-threonylcarbamoyltransferase complex ATPase subunit type 1 TsaE [Candidatus Saccharibacteria bacterium]|nr:tRNA (adenosine(37)-N6)-threonylcarbamoyltransferase complex ATPase subunit type 1 TsaE [Candidatus Saccharibacteria bacterium]